MMNNLSSKWKFMMNKAAQDIEITGYRPGDIGRITELHGTYYTHYWNLGTDFEANVAAGFGAFIKDFDPEYDGAWFARADDKVIGGIFIDGHEVQRLGNEEGRARLRFFILDPNYHGYGLGGRLMEAAMRFCREKGYRRVHLTTFAGLKAARHLYDKYGFQVISEQDGLPLTGKPGFIEQVLEVRLM
jgi:GNAT superfamily N-acetyltransferase